MPGSDSQQRQNGRRLDFVFMEGGTQTSVPSTGGPTLCFYRGATIPRLRARDSASLKAASAAQPVRPGLAVAQKFTVVFYGARIFCRKTAQSGDRPCKSASIGLLLKNRLRNITKSCAKSR